MKIIFIFSCSGMFRNVPAYMSRNVPCSGFYRRPVFSRFIWLRPLSIENSRAVAAELKAIYIENGPLLALQSDQGSEFKEALKGLS